MDRRAQLRYFECLFDGSQESLSQGVQVGRFGDFVAFGIGDVEDVDDLVEMGADFCDLEIEVEIREDFRDVVEQSDAIVGKNGNDSKQIGAGVIEADLRRLQSRSGGFLGGWSFPSSAKIGRDRLGSFDRFDDRLADLFQTARDGCSLEVWVIDQEAVPGGAIGE